MPLLLTSFHPFLSKSNLLYNLGSPCDRSSSRSLNASEFIPLNRSKLNGASNNRPDNVFTREIATYDIPRQCSLWFRFITARDNVSPWLLWTVMAYPSRRGNWVREQAAPL